MNVFDCLVERERVSEFLRCCTSSAKRSRIARAFCAVSFVAPRQLDWMLLMTGLAALVEDRVALRSAIVLALTFHVCSAAAVFAVVKRLVDADWGWVAAACWLINPLAFLIAVQATEASVYGVSALGLLIVHLRVVEARMAGRQPSWRLVAAYGLALGSSVSPGWTAPSSSLSRSRGWHGRRSRGRATGCAPAHPRSPRLPSPSSW